MRNRKVVLVIGQLHQGGAEGQLAHLARGLAGVGWDPSVACLSEVAEPHATALRASGIPVAIIPRRRGRDLSRVKALATLLESTGADLVHSFLVGANAYAYAASRLAGRRRLVVSSRTTMPIRSGVQRKLHAWVFRRASMVIANSERVGDFTVAYYGVSRSRLRVVPNGVAMGEYAGAGEERAASRGDLGLPPTAVVGGTLGRLSREKNLGLFVETAAALARESPSLAFLLVGGGPEFEPVRAAVRSLGMEGRILLSGPRADVPRVLAALDYFIMTSDTEGLPNAIMEAMASGLPVVSTRVGGVPELVADGETGLLVAAGDAGAMLDAARRIALDAGLRRAMGEAGRRRIAEGFSVERMVERTRAVYDEVMSRADSGGTGPGTAA